MFLFNRKKREKRPAPNWVMLMAAAFIVYAMITNNEKEITPTTESQNTSEDKNLPSNAGSPVQKPVENKNEGLLDPKKILNLDAIEGKLWPQKTIKLNVVDNKTGSGEIVVCGQKVTIKYNSFTEDNKAIEKDQKLTFLIGDKTVMPALEKGVLGMKKNGNRTITVPSNMAYGIEKFKRTDVPALANIRFETDMLEVTPELPDTSAYRVIGDMQSQESGNGCGDVIKLHVAIWNVEGKKIFDSRDKNGEPIQFTSGKSEVMLGVELGALKMLPDMHRNLIVPPVLQKTLNGNPSIIDFNLPQNQTVIVDIQSVQ